MILTCRATLGRRCSLVRTPSVNLGRFEFLRWTVPGTHVENWREKNKCSVRKNLTQVFLFFVVQLRLIISSQIPRVRRRPTDQSVGPVSEEHVCNHTFLLIRDGRGIISVSANRPK